MQLRLAIAALMAVFGLAQAKFDHDAAKEHYKKCKELTGAEETYEDLVIKQILPTSEKGICMIQCVMEEKGFYDKDGKYDVDAVLKYMKKTLDGRPKADEQYEKIKTIVTDCAKTDIEGLDKCEVAMKHCTCVKVRGEKEGIYLIEKEEESSS